MMLMMKRRELMGLVGMALGLAGCGGGNSWHQKLTVTVNTPHGEVSGSSVTQVDFTFAEDSIVFAPGYAYNSSQNGEAVVVEVAPRKYLFALLEERNKELAFAAFMPAENRVPIKATATEIQALRQKVELAPTLYPLMVTFGDVNDPKSIAVVKPDNLVSTFGAGYSLKKVVLEITKEEVTKNEIDQILPFLSQENPIFLDWQKYPIDHPLQHVSKTSFMAKG